MLKLVRGPVQLTDLDSSLVLYIPTAGCGCKHWIMWYRRKTT